MKKISIFMYLFLIMSIFISIELPVYATSIETHDHENHGDYYQEDNVIDGGDTINATYHYNSLSNGLSQTTTSSQTHYSSYLVSYFDNLTYNFGVNYKNSCGYIAMSMLLSYYDTYKKDSIVPEAYDVNSVAEGNDMVIRRNSPGVHKDIIADPLDPSNVLYGFTLSPTEYYAKMVEMSGYSLHSKLITIGGSMGFYDFSQNGTGAGTYSWQRYDVLKYYLENISGLSYSSGFTILSNTKGDSSSAYSDEIREYTIQKVKSGYPVLLSVQGPQGSHAIIAYDYDEQTDSLYTHMGWGSDTTHVTPESQGFNRYKSAMIVDLKGSHSHSNNYGVLTFVNSIPNVSYYCYCSSHIHTHDIHMHTYTSFIPINAQKHLSICDCGDTMEMFHIVRIIEPHQRYANCIDCGYLVDLWYGPPVLGELVYSKEPIYLNQYLILVIDNVMILEKNQLIIEPNKEDS